MQSSQLFPRVKVLIAGSLSLLAIALSFTQLGLHFWPNSALVYGIRVDYLSPTLYLLDLLVIASLLIRAGALKKSSKLLVPLIPILLANLVFSANPLASLTWSLRFLLYLSFVFSLSPTVLRPAFSLLLPAGMLFEAVLGAFQVFFGHSLQGIFYWLGERAVAVGTPTVAIGTFFGKTLLRAYGTFSHPNVLAGWLVVTLLVIIGLARSSRSPRAARFVPPAALLASLGTLLTQSRSAALALFFLVVPFYLLRSLRLRLLYFALLAIPLSVFARSGFLTRDLDLSFSSRTELQSASLRVLRSAPVFGSGANSSISLYPSVSPSLRLLQPDHNSFTLFLSWFGLAGFLAFLFTLRSRLPHIAYYLFPILPLLLLDHYLLTSPQGLFILLLYLRVSMNYAPHA